MIDQNINQDSEQNQSFSASAWYFFWDLAKIFAIAFGLVVLLIRPFIAEPFIVSGASMVPNFHNRDYLVIEKISYARGKPQREDVIVFRYPADPKQYFIKRIIGLPGDIVRIADGKVFLREGGSGAEKRLAEEYLPKDFVTVAGGSAEWKLGADQYFVLGDNRSHSSDSRVWGVLPGSYIVGKAWFRVLPFSDTGLVQHQFSE